MDGLDIFLISLGIVSLTLGISFRQGKLRNMYWFIQFSYYRSGMYGLAPLGISFMILGLIPFFFESILLIPLRILVGIFTLLGLYMWLLEPNFARPDWINWLEDNHWEILPILRHEALEMTTNAWTERVQTQADLEAWVAEVRQKHRI